MNVGMFVVSSSHADPMEEFSRLTQQQHTQQHQQPHKLPKWFSPNILRYYVLVHDVTEQAEAKYVHHCIVLYRGLHAKSMYRYVTKMVKIQFYACRIKLTMLCNLSKHLCTQYIEKCQIYITDFLQKS